MKLFEERGPLIVVCDICHRMLGPEGTALTFGGPGAIEFRNEGPTSAVDVANAEAEANGWKVSITCPEEGDYGTFIQCRDCVADPNAWSRKRREDLKAFQ